eukprot:403335028
MDRLFGKFSNYNPDPIFTNSESQQEQMQMQEQLSQQMLAYINCKKQQLQDNNALVLEQIISLGEVAGLPQGWIENMEFNIQAHSDITQNVIISVERECNKQQKGDYQEYVDELKKIVNFNKNFQKFLKTQVQVQLFEEYVGILQGKLKEPLPTTTITSGEAIQEQVQAISNSKFKVKQQAKKFSKCPDVKIKVPEVKDILKKGKEIAKYYREKHQKEKLEEMKQQQNMVVDTAQYYNEREEHNQFQNVNRVYCYKCQNEILFSHSHRIYKGRAYCEGCSKRTFC